MKRPLLATIILLTGVCCAPAQDLQQYLHIRRSYGIVESVGVPALETLVGTRVFEVQGVVKGTMRTGNKLSLLLERTDGQTQAINAAYVPDWAIGTDVPARLIIKAKRSESNGEIDASLIAIAKEEDIQPVEAKLVATQAKTSIARHKKSVASRSKYGDLSKFAANGKAPQRSWVLPSDEATPQFAAFIQNHNKKLSGIEATRMAQGILGFSKLYGVDAMLIVAMVICESDFNPNEVSHAGAMGLGQLMPETVQDYGITNPFDSIQNLYGTVREIRTHIDKYRGETGDAYQSLVLGLAAYNAGEGAVRRHGGVPPYRETQKYVKKVINLYAKLRGYR